MERSLRLSDPIVPQVIQSLRQAIIELDLKPGQALSENDIAQRYGVSRQPVREAFIKLREIGLVQILPSRGTYVVKISVQEVLNARFVREAVECAIVRSAAKLIDAAGVARLSGLVTDQRRAVEGGDAGRFYHLDEVFHREIATIVECDYAARIVESARAQTDRVRYLSLPGATSLDLLIAQHEAIVEAIAARDSAGADAAMRRHLREIFAALPSLERAHPELFELASVPAHARAMMADAAACAV